MRKTILIPTDFTVQSLNILKSVLSTNSSQTTFDVILLHGLSLSDSIRDLLFFSKHEQIGTLTTPEFEEAYEVIKNKYYSQISSLRIDLFTGYNVSAFNNYLEGNKVDEIFVSAKQQFFSNKNSFSLSRFIEKCTIKATTIDGTSNAIHPEKGKVAEVFSQVSIG